MSQCMASQLCNCCVVSLEEIYKAVKIVTGFLLITLPHYLHEEAKVVAVKELGPSFFTDVIKGSALIFISFIWRLSRKYNILKCEDTYYTFTYKIVSKFYLSTFNL